jgi:N-acetylmuramoyl-L-alanine amidase
VFERLASPKAFLTTVSLDCRELFPSSSIYTFLFIVASQFSLHVNAAFADTIVSSSRIWPASEYTRLTLESATPISYSLMLLKNPHRVVLDLENVMLTSEIKRLPGKIGIDYPYIRALRIGRFKPGVLRVVLDLKTEVVPEAFVLKPDPIMALLNEDAIKSAQANALANIKSDVKAKDNVASNRKVSPEIIRLITIAIDPGHGGEDPGAMSRRGTHEKDITLAIARKLKAKIDAEPNMRAALTREGDYFMSLPMRLDKARKLNADLFVSIHADSFVKPHARGSSVFALSESGATSAAAGWLAKKENDADLIGGVNLDIKDHYLKKTLLDLSQTATINDSLKLAREVLSEISEINHLHKNNVEQAGFAVLKSPDIPSILVETAFISNPDEEKRLRNSSYQDKMAKALLVGIKRYLAKNPPLSRSKMVLLE